MISTDATETALAPAEEQRAPKKARAGKHAAHVAPARGKTAKKATPAKKAPKGAKKATVARDRSKKAIIIALLGKANGATLQDIMKVTSWQPHSVRGFISGALIKKAGLKVESFKRENGDRAYAIRG
jgi:hypothetical protein